jgi:hypothetical protein
VAAPKLGSEKRVAGTNSGKTEPTVATTASLASTPPTAGPKTNRARRS